MPEPRGGRIATLMWLACGAMCACSGTGRSSAPVVHDAGAGDASTDSPIDTGMAEGDGGDGGAPGPQLVIEPDQGMTAIYALISSAKHTLDMTMYELEDTTVTGLLTTAVMSGVTVRVILDQNLEMKSNTPAYDALGAAGVQVHWANSTYAATHQKTITVDGTTSAIMTLNLTSYYYKTSRDFAVITTDAADVAAIEATFAADFTNAAITPGAGDDLVWSPTNSRTSMLALMNGATKTLLVENEEMSDTDVVSALSGAASRGVSVEVVMTASKSWDTEFASLVAAGVKVVTYARDAPLYVHAKVILADAGTSAAKVFIGSENFSYSSLTRNRELGLITSDPAILASMNATLSSDFAGGTAYP